MSVELVDSNGPLESADRVYGRINDAPKSFSPDLLYDFIKSRTDTLYPTQGQLSSLDDYVTAFTLQKGENDNTIWEGQGLRATGFADGVERSDLATVGQIIALSTALIVGVSAVVDSTAGRVLYNNAGTLGEYEISGAGKVLMDTNPVVASALTLGTQQTTRGSLVLANTAAGAFPVTLQSSNSTSAAWSLTLPTTAGSNGQALTTNGSGVTTWTSIVTSPGGSDGQFQYNNSSAFGGANLYYESANLLAQRNSTTAQGKRIYNSYTDGSNGEWLSLDWTTTSNTASILTAKNGSGTQRALELGASGAANWRITTSGHLLAVTDNTYDIGATGATRPRNLYVAGTGIFGGLLTTIATALGGAGFNLPHGTAPSSPNNGDVWTTTAGIYARVNGATVGPLGAAVTAAGSNTQVQFNNSGSFGASANLTWSSPTLTIGVAASVTGALSLANATSGSAILTADAANTLALRNSTSAQQFNVYNTYTDSSNYERLQFEWFSNEMYIQTVKAGTGSNRDLRLTCGGALSFGSGSSNSLRWRIDGSGHFIAVTDNTYDIGASGATRPRSIYAGTQFVGATGIQAAPSYTFTGNTTTGLYSWSSCPAFTISGAITYFFSSTYLNTTAGLAFGSATSTGDTILTRAAAATLQHGAADAASPVAQTISFQSVVAGTSNTAGVNATLQLSRGTGTGAGGQLVVTGAVTGSSGSTQNSLVRGLDFTPGASSTAGGALRLFNTYTDSSNGEWGTFDWATSNVLTIGTQKNGTGSTRAFRFISGGTLVADFGVTSGNTWTFTSNNASGGFANAGQFLEPSVPSGTTVFSNVGVAASSRDAANFGFYNAGSGSTSNYAYFALFGDSVFYVRSGGIFALNGITSSFPALKRSSATLQTRLADDSDYAQHAAAYWYAAKAYTVSGLPAGSVGFVARVTDASAPAVGSTVTGGGAAAALVWYNGANYTVIGV